MRENEVVTEELGNGLKYRYLLNAISCNGGSSYNRIERDSTLILHNAKVLCDADLNPLTGDAVSGGKVSTQIQTLLDLLDVTYEQFALAWATLTELSINPPVVEEVIEPVVEEPVVE